jgi:hypothetical protein
LNTFKKILPFGSILLFIIFNYAYPQSSINNLKLLHKLSSEISDSLIFNIGCKNCCYQINSTESKWILEEEFLMNAEKKNLILKNCDSLNEGIQIFIENVNIEYSYINSDYVLRKGNMSVSSIIKNLDKNVSRRYEVELTDTVFINSISSLESSNFNLTRGIHKNISTNNNFFNKILEPALILMSSTLIIFLLFTVRSK